LTQKKLEADMKVTENRIAEKNLQIQRLGSQIVEKEGTISDNRRIIARSFSTLNEIGDKSLLELMLSKDSLSHTWDSLEGISTLQQGLTEHISNLQTAKTRLESNKKDTEKAKAELLSLSKQLGAQKKVIVANTEENNALLRETKNNQSTYTQLLNQRQEQKEAFEREVADLESSLKSSVASNAVPTTGTGVLSYPLEKVRITQYFGNTPFATKNAQIYNGQGHNGVDFAASIGTPVKSAASGIVIGSGNTDTVCPGASYGKWVLVKHNNGLTTVYAHLSYVSATVGQTVSRGETIAYSGYSGNVVPRGPRGAHLHFTVFVSDGVTVGSYKFKSCPGARAIEMPLLTKKGAYLNPLSYF
jgi:murein DD-endopeptidase MepM/ murein hydrolase activator NlpD